MAQFTSEAEGRYCALIGDVVGSRGLPDRSGLQERLRTFLAQLDRRLGPDLAARFELARGDEIQALLLRPAGAVEALSFLAEELHPVRLTWGLGLGALTTGLAERPGQIDGPAFHRARRAWQEARSSDRWLAARGFGEVEDSVLTGLFTLLGALRARWTERQNQFVREARGDLQKNVAQRLGVSPSVVSESLKAAAFQAVLQGEETARRLLEQFGPRAEVRAESPAETNSQGPS